MTKLEANTKLDSMLDLGLGMEDQPVIMSCFSWKHFATEVSAPMRKSLAERFKVLEIDNWLKPGGYDLISALNLFKTEQM